MRRFVLPIFLAIIPIGCTRSSTDPKEVARFFLGDISKELQLTSGEFHYIRHPDSLKFGYLDFQAEEPVLKRIVSDNGMHPEIASRLKSARWPIGLKPIQVDGAKIYANPVMVLICEAGSKRAVVLSMAQFPDWSGKP